jgi:hypothetical protein
VRIQENKQQGERLAEDMRAVEAVIRLFNPDYDLRSIPPGVGRPATHGTGAENASGMPWTFCGTLQAR